jgi:dipeptide/tripeptide permease
MEPLKQALPHLIMSVVVIVAVAALALDHVVTGGMALPIIGVAGGFTLGGTVAGSATGATTTAVATEQASASTSPSA